MTMNEYQDKMDDLSIELGELQAKRDRIEASKLNDEEKKAALDAIDRKMAVVRSEKFRIEDEYSYQKEQKAEEFNKNRDEMIFKNELGSYSKRENIKQEYVKKFPDSELTKDILLADKEIREGKVPSKKVDINELIKALEEARKAEIKAAEESADNKQSNPVAGADSDVDADANEQKESPFKISSKVRIKSLNLVGTLTGMMPNGDGLVKVEGRGLAQVKMNNLESVEELTSENTEGPEVKPVSENAEKPEAKPVSENAEKPVLETASDTEKVEKENNVTVSETPEKRGLVTRIANKALDIFKKATASGIAAIKYFLEAEIDEENENENEIPSKEEFEKGYNGNVESDSDMMNIQAKPKTSKYDTPEQVTSDLKNSLNNDAGMINKGIERG